MAEPRISHNVIWTLPFFSDLNLKEQEKLELIKVAKFRSTQRGEMLFLQGDPLTNLYWLCDGVVQMFRSTPDGRELTAAIRITGDMLFDPNALQHKQTHTMNARAIKETTLLGISISWMEEHFRTYEHLADKFINILSQRAQEALIETEHQATMNAAQIIACFLQHLCMLHHFDPSNFELPYTKSLIASRLGMELESFSRTLPKLKELGITISGKHVSFSNIESAQHYSCGSCSAIGECQAHKNLQGYSKRTSDKKIKYAPAHNYLQA
jgi:CRP-like cAMP-binding protein